MMPVVIFCNLCTRLICRSAVHSESFQKLETLHLPELMKHAHKDFKEILSIFNCVNEKQELFVNCFFDRSKLNHRSLSEEETNFEGFNHPILIFNHMLTIGSRIAMNILYKNLFPASGWRPPLLSKEISLFIVDVIEIMCR